MTTNAKEQADVDSETKANGNSENAESQEWGYDLYPERKRSKERSVMENLMKGRGREYIDKVKCERTVYRCIKESPLIKLMLGALRSSGCALDIRRHIACEECHHSVTGGYDPALNQVVVCQNTARTKNAVHGALAHELIHMFDYCRNDLNFKNIDHLACTEIRAANLVHCSFLSAWGAGDASIFNIKEAHQNCVKSKALASVMAVRSVSKLEAIDAVERVFPKCYADLEPLGRRLRRNSMDMDKAYAEGYLYGYI